VFYYGVLADITPPVALAAYAGAGIAGANPFRAGNTAFRLASAKALVPFVFLYSPAMLIVTEGFTWTAFAVTIAGCTVGIVLLGAALTGYLLNQMGARARVLTAAAALLLVVPGVKSGLAGVLLAAPVIIGQVIAWRRETRRQARPLSAAAAD
jgi:TRAP-type uncharacterized transport system fused permease subunit